jgi:methionyl-tRNA formyltransferase
MVVAAYGLIVPPAILELPRLGAFNIHASLLPRWRGAAPIQRALLAGDSETGITIMRMDAGLDTGPILSQSRVEISTDDDAQSLHDRLAVLGARMIVDALARARDGALRPASQPSEGATYARKVEKGEARLDWRRPAETLERQIRALRPTPGAFALQDSAPLKVWRAEVRPGMGVPGAILSADEHGVLVACGENALLLTELQRAGARRLPAAEFLRGSPLPVGARLT